MSSDEEMPGPMGGDFDEESDNGMDLSDSPENLPEGVQKEIITEGQGTRKPKKGNEVSVHYVGTLASDGTEFDSSRKRDKPFTFTLGKGQVIKGWDLGVATMLKGEKAKFTLAPQFAYGASGSPPTIPENATLVFEVELISWKSQDDLFGDEGVIKARVEEGKGWKTPKPDDEVKISLQAATPDGTIIEDKGTFEYSMGSDLLGPLQKAVEKVLPSMKKGEKITLTCSKDYAYGDKHSEGAVLTLKLEEIYETKDVSFLSNGAVMKKQIKEGDGYETPQDGAKVTLLVSAATDGSAPLAGFKEATLEFTAGNGEVCDALECAAVQMKQDEVAIVTTLGALCSEAKLGLEGVKAEKVCLTVELKSMEKKKDSWSLTDEEKIEFGTERKEVGTALLKAGRLQMALQRYKKVADMFSYVDSMKEEANKEKAKALKQACEANKAAVFLKLGSWAEARTACEAVLKEDKNNVKALYRRAQAQVNLKNFLDAISDLKKVIELDPPNKEARELLKKAHAGQKEEDKKAKGLFANMCKALGKGPIPEPGKAPPVGDFSSDEEDAAMEDAGKAPEAEEKPSE